MRFGHRYVPELDGRDMDPLADAIFGHGRLMNSPATFQQGHLVLFSSWNGFMKSPMQKSSGTPFQDLYCQIWLELARMPLQPRETGWSPNPPSGTQWPSIYVGIDVIVNQETPPHLDKVSAPSLLDLLPGTMIYLAGKLLHHSVPKWEKGERIALAHYMKDAVHNRFGLARPSFTQQKDLLGNFLKT
ncbi:hypothetical protein EV401DRAFT_1886257 [Pisolithus croceorrhizus]|nr:hypothetical protein EV401DRAFT_1886257 [Pisolithus croceorrhizus]